MRNLKYSTIVLVFFAVNVFAQNHGSIQYTMERFEKFTNPRIVKHNADGKLKEKFKSDSIAMAEFDGTKDYFTLDFTTESAHFYVHDLNDEMLELIKRNVLSSIRHYYKNRVEDKNFKLYDISDENPHLLEMDEFSNRDWVITKETKEIEGYTCTKAILIEEFESDFPTYAWFTDEIDLEYGLLDLHGLPGVVLGLEVNHVYIFATSIDFRQKPTIEWPDLPKLDMKEHVEMMGYSVD